MKKYTWLIVGLIGLLIVAAGSYFWATDLIGSIMGYRSPLQHTPPSPGDALGAPLTRRVVIVLVDALRLDTSQDASVMPFLGELRSQGAHAVMHSTPPTFSEPAYTTLLTGATPDINDGPPINLDYEEIPLFTQDDLFSAAHRAGLRTAISGYYWFEKLVPQSAVDDHFYTAGEDAAADVEVMSAAKAMVAGGADQLILIHLDQVDYAGHHLGGPKGEEWDAAASRCDAYIKQIAGSLDLNKDTLIVLSDHGQIDRGGHGGPEPINKVEPFIMVGAGVIPGDYANILQVDVAPTVAVLLGANIPASAQGSPLEKVLVLPAGFPEKIATAEHAQKQNLFQAYTGAIHSEPAIQPSGNDAASYVSAMDSARARRLSGERLLQGLIAILLALIPAVILFLRKVKGILQLLPGALLAILAFHFRYAILDGRTYSLSSVESQSWLITYGAVTAAVALLLGWLLTMLLTRSFRQGALSAAKTTLGFLFITIYLLSLPVLLSFAINGALVKWTLPEFYTIFIAFLALLQALFTAALGLLLVGISALVGRFAGKVASAS